MSSSEARINSLQGMDSWNPEQYSLFQVERSQPFWDLIGKVNFSGVKSLLDVGCGTGELTAQVHKKMQLSESLGIDASPSMMDKTSAYQAPGLSFQLADVMTFVPSRPYDLILSNAALQWVEDHKALFLRMINWLAPKGQLAVQMPVNFDHPSHFLAADVAQEMKLQIRIPPLLAPETYAELLWRNGMEAIDVSIKVYLHPLKSGHEVIEWTKGALLTFYQKQLDLAGYKKFLEQYTRRLLLVTGEGPYLYPYKRIFIVARRKER